MLRRWWSGSTAGAGQSSIPSVALVVLAPDPTVPWPRRLLLASFGVSRSTSTS